MSASQKIHFEISERKILLRFIDIFLTIFVLALIGHYFQFDYFRVSQSNFYWTIVLAIYLLFFGTIFEMYNLQTASNRFQISKSIILTSSVTVLFYLLTPFYTPVLPSNRLQILLFFFSILFSLSLWRYIYIVFLASNRFMKKVLFVGNSKDIDALVAELSKFNPHYHVVGYLSVGESSFEAKVKRVLEEDLDEFVYKNYVSEIVVISSKNKLTSIDLYNKLLSLLEKGIVIRKYNQVYESSTYRLPINFEDKEIYKFFPFSRSNQNKLYVYFNRIFDISFSLVGLFLFFLVSPVLWLVNLFFNKGSFFYTQERIGKNGVPFTIYKMRTMVPNAEQNGAVFATVNDVRITPFGKFLRKTRLDELPQFINVLKGDMAIIGPRPERQIFVDEISATIPLYQSRHVIKPGLTGWAQVNYSYGASLEDSLMKLQYDLYYIKHRSLFLDINIVIKTVSTVLFFRGQ
ncbi:MULTISPECIES: exopolysaccharide biosynthesis polyprenyl glycosylphosphotransferase [unclassified Flavobacterium]|uniref:exopolysaccharide biosynthesis polyprenyl glycosylphosphotransferase n=1 Tax=unclassified Flavobacterium TaxID=196869 RepID=UPI0012912575|nr:MULTISPECIES: exopolysaccharide biosynthesis polyprenyl glycosylphosphotransferase [unclassified Flavobacterium]MQP51997.1 exopolysaccharide biosynthesis polyprenyl glycosylphosphotransferase [Flavobacterium sp. LMO9]MQP61866.1 exopolysaccharide biosynthesis polyprenyl glycosylphosphotransferase [Flavobacterium sp. LMO6]